MNILTAITMSNFATRFALNRAHTSFSENRLSSFCVMQLINELTPMKAWPYAELITVALVIKHRRTGQFFQGAGNHLPKNWLLRLKNIRSIRKYRSS